MSCFDNWAWHFVGEGVEPVSSGESFYFKDIRLGPTYAKHLAGIVWTHKRDMTLEYAGNLEKAERFEDAAQTYESLGMWKEAGDARRKAKRHVFTQVNVDLNSLIDQLRKGGLATTYVCPSCAAPIPISGSTPLSSLVNCQYCGAVFQSTDLVDFLMRVLGQG